MCRCLCTICPLQHNTRQSALPESVHIDTDPNNIEKLVNRRDLRVVRPVVVIIIGPLVSRRIGTGGDEVSVVRRPGQSVVHLVVVAPVDRVLALTSLKWRTPWAAIHANSLNIHKPFATPGDSVQNRVCILHSMNMLYMHATLACYACIQCMFHCIFHSPAHKREKKEQSNLRLGVSGKVHGSSAHGKRGQRSSRISGGWGDRRNFLAEVSELLVGPAIFVVQRLRGTFITPHSTPGRKHVLRKN